MFLALSKKWSNYVLIIADLTGKFSFKGPAEASFLQPGSAKLLPDIHLIVNACKAKEVGEQLSAFKAEKRSWFPCESNLLWP